MLYSTATTLDGFRTAPHVFLNRIGESYFAAPEVFFFEPQGLGYVIYETTSETSSFFVDDASFR